MLLVDLLHNQIRLVHIQIIAIFWTVDNKTIPSFAEPGQLASTSTTVSVKAALGNRRHVDQRQSY